MRSLRAAAAFCAATPHLLASQHAGGEHLGWTVHGTAFVQFVRTTGSRGDYQLGSVNRLMVQSTTLAAGGMLRLHFMTSAEPITIGRTGYPELLQVAFTDRNRPITDRSHPDHWVMNLAGTYEHPLAAGLGWALSLAPVGDPALGPVPYQHRPSATFNPLAPLGHHAQDDTHGSFGVATVGVFSRRVRIEASAFNDRQPSNPQALFDYRGARLDAYSGRISVSPARGWNVSASYGYLPATSGGHAHDAQHRMTAAVLYTHAAVTGPEWSLTAVYGVNRPLGAPALPAALIEGAYGWDDEDYVAYGRVEHVRRSAAELDLVGSVSPTIDVTAATAGMTRRIATWGGLDVRLEAQYTVHFLPSALDPFYGSRIAWSGVVASRISR
jgi:hypothetical protein